MSSLRKHRRAVPGIDFGPLFDRIAAGARKLALIDCDARIRRSIREPHRDQASYGLTSGL